MRNQFSVVFMIEETFKCEEIEDKRSKIVAGKEEVEEICRKTVEDGDFRRKKNIFFFVF